MAEDLLGWINEKQRLTTIITTIKNKEVQISG